MNFWRIGEQKASFALSDFKTKTLSLFSFLIVRSILTECEPSRSSSRNTWSLFAAIGLYYVSAVYHRAKCFMPRNNRTESPKAIIVYKDKQVCMKKWRPNEMGEILSVRKKRWRAVEEFIELKLIWLLDPCARVQAAKYFRQSVSYSDSFESHHMTIQMLVDLSMKNIR